MTSIKNAALFISFLLLMTFVCACGAKPSGSGTADPSGPADAAPVPESNGKIMILYTSDVHCGVEDGFGYLGLQQIRDSLEAQGYATVLVDDGDSIQGGNLGTLTKGESVIELMNQLHYDVVIPGNHEFDFGMEQFMKLTEQAEFPYISCNFNKNGELVFPPYLIKEVGGIKIGFVGVTTPETLTTSTPEHFQDETGAYVYGFMQDESGGKLYSAVQKAVDDVRAEGADYVYLLAHLGNEANCQPYTYADVISHTNGIDVLLDGHSHDTDQIVMKNKDGQEVARSACGTKMECIGYSCISIEDGVEETGIWSWSNEVSAPELLGIQNELTDSMDKVLADMEKETQKVVAKTGVPLWISDPVVKDQAGLPVRMIRRAETNLGDLVADAYRFQTGADIGLEGGGAIRVDVPAGDLTYGQILDIVPFGSTICVVEATGQQILDALEWGVKDVPDECGCFLQVSGLSYEVDTTIDSGCTMDENGWQGAIIGERRIKNVKVGDEPLDPAKLYVVGGDAYYMLGHGDGMTAFNGANVLNSMFSVDNQVLIDYITDTLNGMIGDEYSDPFGQGRITILE